MDDLINDFIAETREMLEALSGEIVAWEAMPDAGARVADARLVSAVLAVIDRLGELVEALETGETLASEDDSALIDALSAEAPAEAAEEACPASHAARSSSRTIRLPVDLLDRMM